MSEIAILFVAIAILVSVITSCGLAAYKVIVMKKSLTEIELNVARVFNLVFRFKD